MDIWNIRRNSLNGHGRKTEKKSSPNDQTPKIRGFSLLAWMYCQLQVNWLDWISNSFRNCAIAWWRSTNWLWRLTHIVITNIEGDLGQNFKNCPNNILISRARSDHIFRDLRSLTILLPNCDLRSLTITFSKSWTIRSRSWSAIILPITPLLCLIIQRAVFLWKEPYILKAHDLGMSQILRLRAAFGINIWIFPLENGYKGNEIRSKIPFFAVTT